MARSREEIVQMKRVFSYLRDHAYTVRIQSDIDMLEKDMNIYFSYADEKEALEHGKGND